jgi:hypothetical protein
MRSKEDIERVKRFLDYLKAEDMVPVSQKEWEDRPFRPIDWDNIDDIDDDDFEDIKNFEEILSMYENLDNPQDYEDDYERIVADSNNNNHSNIRQEETSKTSSNKSENISDDNNQDLIKQKFAFRKIK